MIAFVTIKSRFSQVPEQNRVMIKCENHTEVIDTICKMVDASIKELNVTGILGTDPIELTSFDMKRISTHLEDLHYEVVYRIKMNVE